MRKKIIYSFILIVGIFTKLAASSIPALNGRVNDNAKIMNSRERQEAEEYLAAVEKQNGIQIAVLTVKSLQGESLESYSMKVAEKWKLGQKDQDNGILLLVAYNERGVRIEVGYGLEGTLTDTKCGLIIRNVIIPEFKEGDYGEGILKGIKTIGGIVSGDVSVEEKLQKSEEVDAAGAVFAMIFVLVWSIIILSALLRRYGIMGLFIWNMFGGHSSGRRNNSGFGGFSGGGFSGGGFSGGGGHFGGGGASGHW